MFAVPRPRVADRPDAVPVIVPLESGSDPLSAFSTERAIEPVSDRHGAAASHPRGEHGAPLVHPRRSIPRRLLPFAFAAGLLTGAATTAGLAALAGADRSTSSPREAAVSPLLNVMAMAPCVAPAAPSVAAQAALAVARPAVERRAALPPAAAPPVGAAPAVAPVPRAATVPASGALAIASPFVVQAFVDGVPVGDSTTARLTVPAGSHELRLVNDELEFSQVSAIEVTARSLTRLQVERPMGTLHVNAQPWAQVWVDGRRMGDTPLGNLRLPIGAHDVLLRHPALGEERRTVVVGARTPVHLGVEFPR